MTAFACWRIPGEQPLIIQGDLDEWTDDQHGFIVGTLKGSSVHQVIPGEPESFTIVPLIEIAASQEQSTSRNEYTDAFDQYIHAFAQGEIQKAILSRKIVLPAEHIDPDRLFKDLMARYPDAYVYLFHDPKHGTWAGASPEILLRKRTNSFETVSLAGTLPVSADIEDQWTQKERDEQHFVTDHILAQLKQQGCAPTTKGPFTTTAGKVAHLKTELRWESNSSVSTFIEALHPTPAVCGTPPDSAFDLIQRCEPYERELYTGFMGYVGSDADIWVNLRCMKIVQHAYILYVGGGLTAQSEVEKEWNETEAKASTLRSVIEKN